MPACRPRRRPCWRGSFPRDADRLLALARQAAESRLWAGIHYRFDIDAGAVIGRQVAEKALKRAAIVGK